MNCPIDGTALVMSERSGIEIDYCPQCRGVWLDRGELDKIIERSAGVAGPGAAAGAARPARSDYDGRHDDHGYAGQKPRRKENWLGELFG
ncbi:Zn-finger nucleic acid-binding protein [Marisediminicola sp. UYEF4]|uniref:TFIIB-type zinc ribbon-containing protein n=1 Tax=Marisediminicola sp. UYEF4 TaxID=1756384 RepID=UPI0033948CED